MILNKNKIERILFLHFLNAFTLQLFSKRRVKEKIYYIIPFPFNEELKEIKKWKNKFIKDLLIISYSDKNLLDYKYLKKNLKFNYK